MAKKKSTRKRTPAPKQVSATTETSQQAKVEQTATITARELLYLTRIAFALTGLYELVKATKGGDWSQNMAPAHACEKSSDNVWPLDRKLTERFETKHGRLYDSPKEASISISKEEILEFEEAMEPACSFFNLVGCQDLGEEGLIANSVGNVGGLIQLIAREGLDLLRSRLEGDAQ